MIANSVSQRIAMIRMMESMKKLGMKDEDDVYRMRDDKKNVILTAQMKERKQS